MKAEPTSSTGGVLRELDRFWFGYGSVIPMAVFRLVAGTLIFIDLLMRLPTWAVWYSDRGLVPAWTGALYLPPRVPSGFGFQIPRFDPLLGVTDARIGFAVYLVIIGAAVLTTIGLYTRPASIVLALGIIALHHRNAIILHGGDSVVRLGAMYLALAPSGAALSIDALRRGTPAPLMSQWPRRLVQFNMALIYFTTTWGKYFGDYWKHGLATYFPARLNEFKRFPVPGFFNDLPFVYVTTYGTLVIEFSLAILVWFRPLRKWVLAAGMMLHGFIEWTMNIPLFSFLMMSMYVVWFDGDELEHWWERTRRRIDIAFLKLRPAQAVDATQDRAIAGDPLQS